MNQYWEKGGFKDHAIKDLDKELDEYHKQAAEAKPAQAGEQAAE